MVFVFVEGVVGVISVFGAGEFAGDEILNVGEVEAVVERHEVNFDLAGLHEVDAGEEDAVDVEEGLTRRGDSFSKSFHWVSAKPK
jgi:hypothetical protein